MKTVSIISTGNELIFGSVQDTNAFYISNVLFKTDFIVKRHLTVGDAMDHLDEAIIGSLQDTDIVIVTGGLGSTDDDYTLRVILKVFSLDAGIDRDALERLNAFFDSMGRKILERDLRMVTVPDGAVVFQNDAGLSPGYAVKSGKRTIIAMPGVPSEMRVMFDRVLAYLHNEYGFGKREYCTIRTVLMRESVVNNLINKMDIPFDQITWGVTTTPGMNEITFVRNEGALIDPQNLVEKSQRVFGDNMLMPASMNLEFELLEMLLSVSGTISVAESCTGGLISKRLTDIPGSSRAFLGGVVSYSNESKVELLGVSRESIMKYGAVSSQVAAEMADGVRKRFASSVGISTTGIAGPGGGTDEKPVGTVFFGMSTCEKNETFSESIIMDRERFRFFASQYAMNKVRLHLKGVK
jgi:nicotinamide-nucleotide amidase